MAVSISNYVIRQVNAVSSSSWVFNFTASAQTNLPTVIVACLTTDNISTTTGNSNTHTSLVDSLGRTWTKLGEVTVSSGTAGDGLTSSAWSSGSLTAAETASYTTSVSVTATFTAATTSKVIQAATFVETSASLSLNQMGVNPGSVTVLAPITSAQSGNGGVIDVGPGTSDRESQWILVRYSAIEDQAATVAGDAGFSGGINAAGSGTTGINQFIEYANQTTDTKATSPTWTTSNASVADLTGFALAVYSHVPRVAPSITSFEPAYIERGVQSTITIFGSGFADVTSVLIGGISSAFTIVDSSTITVTSPAGLAAGTHNISVTNSVGTGTISGLNVYISNKISRITQIKRITSIKFNA